jgi:hypothetical protein
VSDSVDQQLGHTPVPRATPHPTASPAVTPHQEPAL